MSLTGRSTLVKIRPIPYLHQTASVSRHSSQLGRFRTNIKPRLYQDTRHNSADSVPTSNRVCIKTLVTTRPIPYQHQTASVSRHSSQLGRFRTYIKQRLYQDTRHNSADSVPKSNLVCIKTLVTTRPIPYLHQISSVLRHSSQLGRFRTYIKPRLY